MDVMGAEYCWTTFVIGFITAAVVVGCYRKKTKSSPSPQHYGPTPIPQEQQVHLELQVHPDDPVPQTLPRNAKEELIAKGEKRDRSEYPTLDEVLDDIWSESEQTQSLTGQLQTSSEPQTDPDAPHDQKQQ